MGRRRGIKMEQQIKNKIKVCKYCLGEVGSKQVGEDDYIDYCNNCELVVEAAGETIYIMEEEQ